VYTRAGYHVRACIVIERIGTRDQQPADKAHRAAAAYRLAAQIALMNVDVGACIAIDVDAHEGHLTLEMGEHTDTSVVQCLMGDALTALRLPFEHRAG
jgi:hypothetical protein